MLPRQTRQHPQEYEDADWQKHVINHEPRIGIAPEGQDGKTRERQRDIHLRHHGIGPVVNGVFVSRKEAAAEEVYDSQQIRYEYRRWGHSATKARNSDEQEYSCRRTDEAVDTYILTLIHKTRKLPYRHAGN